MDQIHEQGILYCRQDRVSAAEQRKEEQSRLSEANGCRVEERQASSRAKEGEEGW
jgi:hypothetical protein